LILLTSVGSAAGSGETPASAATSPSHHAIENLVRNRFRPERFRFSIFMTPISSALASPEQAGFAEA
jgi:hypothetical protein